MSTMREKSLNVGTVLAIALVIASKLAYKRATRWVNAKNDYSMLPMQVQAITWLYYRAMRGIANSSLGNYESVPGELEETMGVSVTVMKFC